MTRRKAEVQHRPFTSPAEAKAADEHPDACRFCSLTKSEWERLPECGESDPLVRGARGYNSREKKDPWEGRGFRVLEPWMMGPDEGRYGHALRRLTVVDLVGVIRSLDDDQKAAFVKLMREAAIPGVTT